MALGQPLFLEALDYNAIELRQLIEACLSPGVVGSGDFLVSERGAGANMSVDVAAGHIVIAGTDNAGQGSYLLENDATANVVIGAAPGSNSRIDVVYVKINDDTEDSGGSNLPDFGVEPGTPAGSPVAPAIPDSAIALAHVLIASGDTDIDADQITDVRTFAASPSATQAGSGTTDGSGRFDVVFDRPYATPPMVVAIPVGTSTHIAKVSAITATGCRVHVDNNVGAAQLGAVANWIATPATQ